MSGRRGKPVRVPAQTFEDVIREANRAAAEDEAVRLRLAAAERSVAELVLEVEHRDERIAELERLRDDLAADLERLSALARPRS